MGEKTTEDTQLLRTPARWKRSNKHRVRYRSSSTHIGERRGEPRMILRLSRLLSDMFAPGGDFGRTLPIFWCAPPKPNVPTLAATPAALALARAVGFFRGTLVVFREIPAFPFPAFFFPAFFFAVSIMKNEGVFRSHPDNVRHRTKRSPQLFKKSERLSGRTLPKRYSFSWGVYTERFDGWSVTDETFYRKSKNSIIAIGDRQK